MMSHAMRPRNRGWWNRAFPWTAGSSLQTDHDCGGRAPKRRLHVVILVRSFGFPNGMANTNRARLLGRALTGHDVGVTVLCSRVSEKPGSVHNTRVRGVTDGISFRYTAGTTVRPDSFIWRRIREAQGYVGALLALANLKAAGKLDCVYLWSGAMSWQAGPWLLVRYLNTLRVPVIVELNERPWEVPARPRVLAKRLSFLDGVSGVVAISTWLAEWAEGEARRLRRQVRILDLPIVVDVAESTPSDRPPPDQALVYAASPGYDAALAFILAAMQEVWRRHPECKLTVTGGDRSPSREAADSMQEDADPGDERVIRVGYVDRDALLHLFAQASALLIPLFDDDRSRARFPSKIGEYLAAARPIVTTRVGEIERFFQDGENAFVANPGDATAYAQKIIEVLDDPAAATAVGRAGLTVAMSSFDYSLHGAKLRTFVESLSESRQ